MTEKLLQYLWQFQYFNKSVLRSVNDEKLEILLPGILNHNQGPDFINAKIKIDTTVFFGSVELHLKTSQWMEHGHHHDLNYNNVILHVVFENDSNLVGHHIPVLELQPRIPALLLHRYTHIMQANSFIPCAATISEIKDITWIAWKERLLAERLTRKAKLVFEFLEKNTFHWEETFWWMLARNFGIKVNSDAFEAVAQSISTAILSRHKSQIHQLEALIMGQAGLLNCKFREDYPNLLKKEYSFLQKKYGLQPIHIPIHFLRMRPGNFPTIRLAQLAMLVHHSVHLFSKILEMNRVTDIQKLFRITANDYWHYHYLFDEPTPFKRKTLGTEMINKILINTVVPIVFAFGLHHKNEGYKSKAINWLEELAGETNHITKGFTQLQMTNSNAYDSQALIELKTQYCDHKLCLQCAVGNALLRN